MACFYLMTQGLQWPQVLCETQIKSPSIRGFGSPLLHCAFPTFVFYIGKDLSSATLQHAFHPTALVVPSRVSGAVCFLCCSHAHHLVTLTIWHLPTLRALLW